MPAPTRPTARRRYSQDDLQKALDGIKNEGMSMRHASKAFGIPLTTIHDKLHGKYKEEANVGRPSVLTTEEEDIISQWVIDIGRAGFPVTKAQLIESVAKLIKDLNRDNPFNNGVPGEKWYSLFLKRNPMIAQRVSQGLTTSRANVSEEKIRAWFQEIKEYAEEKEFLDVFKDPSRVFNADETAFFLCPKGKTVLAKKGEKTVYSVSGNDEKECITVLVNGNAAGQLAPPMVVYSYERIPAAIVQTFPDEWAIGKSETGWMTTATFYEYITNVFYPWLVKSGIKFPVILFIDGHTSHLSIHLSDFCSEKKIEVVALYPNSTHLIQPMDVSVFRPLKGGWKKGADRFRFEHGGRKMRKDEFAPLLKQVMETCLKPETISSGFKATGLVDLDPDKVHFGNLIQRTSDQPSIQYLEHKLQDLRNYLAYTEAKIGLPKIQMFARGDILLRDESLHELWISIKEEVAALDRDIKKRLVKPNKNLVPPPPPTELDVTSTQESVDGPEEMEDPVEARVVAEATNEGEVVEIDFPIFSDFDLDDLNDGVEFDVIVHNTDDAVLVSTPSVTVAAPRSPSWTNSAEHTASPSGMQTTSQPIPTASVSFSCSPHSTSFLKTVPSPTTFSPSSIFPISPVARTSPSTPQPNLPGTSSTPQPNLPGTSSSTPQPNLPETSSNHQPNLPSPFKRCLIFPTPPNGKKKKLFNREVIPSTITGSKFKEYIKRKEEKKLEMEKEKERKRIAREEKKKMKEDKVLKKTPTSRLSESEEDADDPDPVQLTSDDLKDLSVNSWVVVPYVVDDEKVHFPGQVKQIHNDTVSIKFLTKKGNKYVWPEEEDIDESVPLTEIVQLLSAPHVERRGFFSFKEKIFS